MSQQNDQLADELRALAVRVESLEISVRLSHDLHESHNKTLAELSEVLKQLRELLEAWNNTKGAFVTIRFIGNAIKWVVGVGAAFAILWAAFRMSLAPDAVTTLPPPGAPLK